MNGIILEKRVSGSGFSIVDGDRQGEGLQLEAGWTPRERWVTVNDFLNIAARGYDRVRIPVGRRALWKTDGSRDEETFEAIGQVASHARVAGLKVTVDVRPDNAGETVWKTKTDLKTIFINGFRSRLMHKPGKHFSGYGFLTGVQRVSA